MKIRLEKISLDNYKCFIGDKKEFVFGERTKISGHNASGKTTIMNAFMEVMTGKEVDGTQPDAIRPHDANGKDLNKSDIIRDVVLSIDNIKTTIRKVTKQKWRKPHGQTEEILDGNTISYEIDGFPYAPKKFDEYMKKIADPETLLMCSNPKPFISVLKKSTVDARKILENLSGFGLEDFLANKPQYLPVLEITKGHSVEDSMKKLRKQLNDQKKKLAQKDTELKYEQTRDSGVKIENSDLELAKGEWKEKIANIDKQEETLDETGKVYDLISAEICSLKRKGDEIRSNSESNLRKQRMEFEQKISNLNIQKKEYVNDLKMAEMDLKHARMGIERNKTDLEKAKAEYSLYSNKIFDDSKIREIKAEEFDENAFICPECGQVRPESQRIDLKETFEKSKIRRIAEQENAKIEFQKTISKKLDVIESLGNKADSDLKESRDTEREAFDKIENIKEKIFDISSAMEATTAELSKFPTEIVLTENEEYQLIKKTIAEKEKELLSVGNESKKRAELRIQRNQYIEEISKLDAQIQKNNSEAEQKEKKLLELKTEFDKQKQIVADIEREIDIINHFSIEKNAALAERINPYMDGFKFNFLTYTLENNPVECCQIIRGGTEYNDLNYSDRLLVETAMVRGFQKMNNLDLPIWIDNSESINDDRLPELDTQMIVLKVDNNELTVNDL